jgi:hypothetical protein
MINYLKIESSWDFYHNEEISEDEMIKLVSKKLDELSTKDGYTTESFKQKDKLQKGNYETYTNTFL